MFPLLYDCDSTIIVDYHLYEGLKCFEEESLYYNPTGEDCRYLTQIELGLSNESSFSLQINLDPAIDEVQFSGIEAGSIEVIDHSGKIYLSEKVDTDQKINASNLSSECPFAKYKLMKGHSATRKLIKK